MVHLFFPLHYTLTATDLFTKIALSFPECHMVWLIEYAISSDWLLSHINDHLRFLHVFSWLGMYLLLLLKIWSAYLRTYKSFFLVGFPIIWGAEDWSVCKPLKIVPNSLWDYFNAFLFLWWGSIGLTNGISLLKPS